MVYSVFDHIYVSLYYLVVTKKEPQENDPNFVKKRVKPFQGMGIADFMLYILSCVTMLKNTHGFTCLT